MKQKMKEYMRLPLAPKRWLPSQNYLSVEDCPYSLSLLLSLKGAVDKHSMWLCSMGIKSL